MADGLLVPNKCKACGGQLNDLDAKYCPHCGRLLDEIQEAMNRKNKSGESCLNCGSSTCLILKSSNLSVTIVSRLFQRRKSWMLVLGFIKQIKLSLFKWKKSGQRCIFMSGLAMTRRVQ
ncbi:hypothetical protein CI088_02130 [Enterococcus plantarum]|uniref:DZANK-type domain-containing protein n=1 Tax=Enterococcus plantarum TaxID=1077675 RepID=A0A2W3ZK73_9ENTE|nr:hypothetical protein CI088_02130 [Enterococcus plantarum]